MAPTRILLADDHDVLRDGLRLILERQPDFEVVAEASDGHEALALAELHNPDVAVLDVAMPALNGIEVTSRIVASGRPTAIVILSMYYDESYIVRALKAGAKAYLLKDSVRADLIAAVHAVIQGRTYFSPKIGSLLQEDHFRAMTDKQKDDSFELLTTREREILQLAAEGKGNKEIASLLNVSMYTVDTHRSHILRKLNLHTAPELVLYAVRKGIIR